MKRGKEKRRKKRTKRRRSKEEVSDLSWRDLLEKHVDLSDGELDSCAHVHVVPDVIDVLVSPSSVVTELCEVFSCSSDWEDVAPPSFFFLQKNEHIVVQVRKKR